VAAGFVDAAFWVSDEGPKTTGDGLVVSDLGPTTTGSGLVMTDSYTFGASFWTNG